MQIEYIRSARRTLAIEVKPDGRVLVRLPYLCPQAKAQEFADKHRKWIDGKLEQMRRRHAEPLSDAETASLRAAAKAYIPGRVEYYSRLTGLAPAHIGITAAKTRFGSCSGKNRLNFSLYLMQYSKKAIDYVVLHELCHIVHKNHSAEFYRLVERYMPDYREQIKELRGK